MTGSSSETPAPPSNFLLVLARRPHLPHRCKRIDGSFFREHRRGSRDAPLFDSAAQPKLVNASSRSKSFFTQLRSKSRSGSVGSRLRQNDRLERALQIRRKCLENPRSRVSRNPDSSNLPKLLQGNKSEASHAVWAIHSDPCLGIQNLFNHSRDSGCTDAPAYRETRHSARHASKSQRLIVLNVQGITQFEKGQHPLLLSSFWIIADIDLSFPRECRSNSRIANHHSWECSCLQLAGTHHQLMRLGTWSTSPDSHTPMDSPSASRTTRRHRLTSLRRVSKSGSSAS